ncbi:ABC transporter permease [Gammaproteobacteria bacterium]|nr:ABC transporter permease [Gammaproteobacteria bacterium]MDB4004546.1 ABC transporter permease [Gammaproteobacteria bacterium]MDC1358275.1 ABC transporter permease [Gammaproteobacteria bacterium]MDC1502751.1 ABC transporter permease [Gammaproteobacteria bacterium]HAU08985.1 ABC transporter permease [Gammaproteobacteria bacterium]
MPNSPTFSTHAQNHSAGGSDSSGQPLQQPLGDGSKSWSTLIGLASRLLWRDWRSGELRLLFLALVMAVTSVSGIALFTDRLEKALLLESANMLAADRVLGSGKVLPDEILNEAQTRGLRTASTLSFTSMAFSDSGNMLVSAKAVSDTYPLRGDVIIADAPFIRGAPIQSGPQPGEVWLESRALPALGLEVGDSVYVGEAELTVSKIIIAEPDRSGGGMVDNAGPRLMLHLDDVAKTNVVQLGSRVSYRFLFAADELLALDEFETWVDAEYEGEYRLRDVRDESEEVSEALSRAESFLLLGSLFAVLLAGVAIALTAKRYSERHYDYVAILKTFGCTSPQIGFIYLWIQALLAIVAVVVGSVLGWGVHHIILRALQTVITVELPAAGFEPFVVGAMTAVICLLSFALPPLLALRETPPLRVLRKDISQQKVGANVPYVFGIGGTIGLVYWYSQDAVLTSVLVVAVASIAILLSGLSFLLLSSSSAVGMRAGSAWKLAMSAARRRRKQNVLQVMVFSVTIMSLLILGLLRTDLIADWQAQLPENTPNHFMMNISQPQIAGIEEFFEENGVQGNAFYPLISARVTKVNGATPDPQEDLNSDAERGTLAGGGGDDAEEESAKGAARVGLSVGYGQGETNAAGAGASSGKEASESEAGDEPEEGEVRGRLSRRQVTWAAELPADNRVTGGEWWEATVEPGFVSIEQDYADWLDIELGDVIEFEINAQTVSAEVSSFRSVRWDNMQPNFFIIFSPGTIDHLGATFLSTALMEREQKILLNELVQRFPTIVVIEIDALIEQIQNIIAQVTSAIELISVLVLVCGALVLLACVNATLDERFYENAILRTLGAGKRLIMTSLLIEFASIGLMAGLVATLGAEASLYYLQEQVFEQEFALHYWVWLAGPLAGMIIIGGLGVNSTRGVVNISPLNVLRRLN